MAEELALHEVGRNRGAVDRNHRPIGPRAGAMNGPGNELLARAAFAADQHAAWRRATRLIFALQIAHRMAQSPISSS